VAAAGVDAAAAGRAARPAVRGGSAEEARRRRKVRQPGAAVGLAQAPLVGVGPLRVQPQQGGRGAPVAGAARGQGRQLGRHRQLLQPQTTGQKYFDQLALSRPLIATPPPPPFGPK
jgi:hypothetical protein